MSDEAWASALERAVDGVEAFVIQRFVNPDRVELDFSHELTGERARHSVPFVAGPFISGGALSGLFVRHGVPGSGMVLNAHQGARMNSVVLVDGPC